LHGCRVVLRKNPVRAGIHTRTNVTQSHGCLSPKPYPPSKAY